IVKDLLNEPTESPQPPDLQESAPIPPSGQLLSPSLSPVIEWQETLVHKRSTQTNLRTQIKKNRSAQSQTDHVQPPIQTSDVGTQTREENVTSEELNTIFNTTALETMADLLGLPSLPSIVRKFYRTHEKDDQNADQNEEKFGSFHQIADSFD
uniref:Uncharacterized protein n=2 Tax=Clytia hemisphaerica TaxID=252671 RepID=A0A7M5X8L0_9CNID